MNATARLLAGIRHGNAKAWEQLTKKYSRLIRYWGMRWGLNETDAEDLMQEVFLRLVQVLPTFSYDPTGSFESWLRKVSLNTHRANLRRKQLPIDRSVIDLTELLASNKARSVPELQDDLHSAIQSIRRHFPLRTWALFWESTLGRCSARDVANRHQVNVCRVYAARSQVMRRLRSPLTTRD